MLATINKEAISQLHLPTREVLTDTEARLLRQVNLWKATLLGNTLKHKVRICFDAEEGTQVVETTVWTVTDSHVQLKGGVSIPIACIRSVELS